MTKKFIFLIFMCLFGGLSSHLMAQETVVIVDGTVGNLADDYTTDSPFNTNYKYNTTQQFYYANELAGGIVNGFITHVAFNVETKKLTGTISRTMKIYMVNTDSYKFASKKPTSMSSTDVVFDGEVSFDATGWMTIELTTPFEYTGSNILLCTYDYTGVDPNMNTNFDAFKWSGKTDTDGTIITRGLYKRSSSAYDPESTTSDFTINSYIPDVKFTFTADGSFTPTYPTVTLNTPANEATDIFNPTLNFTLGSADQYQIQMAESTGEFSTLQDWTEGNGSISYQTNLLKSNTTYSWKVIAKNEDGETTSDVYTFTTKEFGAPGAITNASPENGAQDLINPVLSWTFGENTEQQQLLIDGVVKVDWTNIGSKTNDSYQTSGLTAGEHTWQVNVRNGADNGETEDVDEGVTVGTVYTFTVANLPDNVTAVSPANGATNVSSNKIKWQFANGTEEYRLLVHYGNDTWGWENGWEYELGDNLTWIPTNGAEEMEFELENFETSKTYYWAVDVKNSVGQRTVYQGGDPITVYSFTTASTLAVSNTAPANGATNLENPALRWNYVGNAQQYRVYLGTDENNLQAVTEWTTREDTSGSYQTTDLNGSTEHFWRVDIKDEDGSVIAGEVWSFVTTLPAPTNVVATPAMIFPTLSMTYGSTKISWNTMDGANGYNVYLGTEKLNAELIRETSYEIAAILEYNMDPGYDFFVQAVYELGESEMSEAANVKVTGSGIFKATIYSNDWNNRLAGATVTLTFTEDEFGNIYENGEGGQYTYTTNSNGEAFEEFTINGEPQTTTSMRLYNGTYSVVVEKNNYDTFSGSVTISNKQTSELYEPGEEFPGVILHIDSSILFDVNLSDISFESINVNLEGGASAGQYHVYLRNGDDITDLGMKDFVAGATGNIYITYTEWGNLGKGSYLFGVAKVEDQINWSDVAFRNYDVFETEGSWSEAANWRDKELPGTNAEVYVFAPATIEAEDEISVGDINIKTGGKLTINGSLTADNVYNAVAGDVIINDGAQLRQNNANLKAKFVMNIVTPTNWTAEGNTDGWQFIASPFTNAAISDFTAVTGGYDLFKFDGTKKDKEWVNQNKESNNDGDDGGDDGFGNIIQKSKEGESEPFETQFVNGRGYLASYETATTATLSGTVNNATTHTYTVAFDAENQWANFHLLGNPFTFDMDMDWSNVQKSNLADGFVTIDPVNGYKYNASGTIAVGDGFFVKVIGEDPILSYSEGTRGYKESSNSIDLIATGNAGSDNVIINLNEEKEGFNKLDNFNKNIASIFVSKNNKRYGIASYDKDVTEIAVCFDAKQMGSYTIAAKPQGEFETLVLVDRFTGIETNLLVEDYTFTATSNDNYNRFIIKLETNSQEPTANGNFAYVSGEDLILNIEGSVQIIDVMGRVVYANDVTSDNNRINVSDFENAAYVIRVVNENGVKAQKIVL